jgi:NodT family efflux transporter outer membrane factor (OMF) lipoprotein
MRRVSTRRLACAPLALLGLALLAAGCTTLTEWVHNGFRVGPNFHAPPGPVAANWIDAADPHIRSTPANDAAWWDVFGDPTLGTLIDTAYRQNLDLRTAATRVLQAEAQRNITAGNLFPQTQNFQASYLHGQITRNIAVASIPGFAVFGPPNIVNLWNTGFNASWELDFWGRLRRNVESANAQLDSSVENYRAALVTLVAEVATAYVQIRTFQQRIAYARQNAELQRGSLGIAEARLREGAAPALDVEQARANLAQTEATIPPLVVSLRQANNRLCVLLGQPPEDLLRSINEGAIPTAPPEVAVGIPADLLRRRPDVRRAMAAAAAQSAQIGVAEADFYPRVAVSGYLGYVADDITHLFGEGSWTGIILPSVQWKLLNYGRILNNVRYQDALFRQRVLEYQQAVLTAGREVEDGLVAFVQNQVQARSLERSVRAAERSVELVLQQYRSGRADFNRVFTTESQLVVQQDQLAATRGSIALALISVYRALGGGWQVFEEDAGAECASPPTAPGPQGAAPEVPAEETLPAPRKQRTPSPASPGNAD